MYAGYVPKKKPTRPETASPAKIAHTEMLVGKVLTSATTWDIPMPTTTPVAPPTSESVIASVTNC